MNSTKPQKPVFALRVPIDPQGAEQAREAARRYGYRQVAPFVRRLLDAAAKSDPRTGIILISQGGDGISRAA